MARLSAALDSALAGHGGIVMLTGVPGIGKTRTAREISDRAGAAGATVLWGRCSEERGAPPFWPWVQIVRAYSLAHTPEDLFSDLGSGAADLAGLVPELVDRLSYLGDLQPAAPPPAGPDVDQARFRLFDSVMSFF